MEGEEKRSSEGGVGRKTEQQTKRGDYKMSQNKKERRWNHFREEEVWQKRCESEELENKIQLKTYRTRVTLLGKESFERENEDE